MFYDFLQLIVVAVASAVLSNIDYVNVIAT